VAGDAGQHVGAGAGVDWKAELGRLEAQPRVEGERERRASELRRVDPEKKVVHHGVPHERHLEHVGALYTGFFAELGGELGEAAAHGPGELLLGARVEHHVRHTAHQVLAEADLGVHLAGRGDDVAGMEVAEVPGDGRRPDIERDPVRRVVEARPDRRDHRPVVDGDGHAPAWLGPKSMLEITQDV
jgi:hypothetical protein